MHECPYCERGSGHHPNCVGDTDENFCVPCKMCGELIRIDHDCHPDLGCFEFAVKRDAPETF